MSNYDIEDIKRKERYERFDPAVSCLDISPVTMLALERIAEKKDIPLKDLIETWLLESLDRELSKDDRQLEFSFIEGRYG